MDFLFPFLATLAAYFWFTAKPSNERVWSQDQTVLPHAHIDGARVHVFNIRNFSYTSPSTYTPEYYDKIFNTEELTGVYYVVEPFSKFPGLAHTFLSFEFGKKDYLAVSIEIRKQEGQRFSPFRGLFRQYEIMYVVGDERDLIKLRSNYRKDSVYVYPINITKHAGRELFLDMIKKINRLKEKPEFYNTITNTCATNIVHHVNNVLPRKIPFSLSILLPEYSDKLAYKLGLVKTDLPFQEAKEKFKINERAEKYANSEDFSLQIRNSKN